MTAVMMGSGEVVDELRFTFTICLCCGASFMLFCKNDFRTVFSSSSYLVMSGNIDDESKLRDSACGCFCSSTNGCLNQECVKITVVVRASLSEANLYVKETTFCSIRWRIQIMLRGNWRFWAKMRYVAAPVCVHCHGKLLEWWSDETDWILPVWHLNMVCYSVPFICVCVNLFCCDIKWRFWIML